MSLKSTCFWILLAHALCGAAARADDDPTARPFTLQEHAIPGRLRSVTVRDLDGDGIKDLVYVAAERGRREMGYFRGRERGGYEREPAHRLRLKPDVILVGLGDLDPTPGAEFVLFTPGSVFVYRHGVSDESKRYRRLFRTTLFFSFADPDAVPIWPYVLDIDGDGLEDLCLPTWGGYAMWYQSRPAAGPSTFERRNTIDAAVSGRAERPRGKRITASVNFNGQTYGDAGEEGGSPSDGFMVESRRTMAAPLLVDENADGRIDLILVEHGRVRVWRQRKDGSFAKPPDVSHDARKLFALAPSWADNGNLLLEDVNADGRIDGLARQAVEKEIRTRLLFFPGGIQALSKAPRRILVLKGLTSEPRFSDVNGDRRLDLLVPTFRVDLLNGARRAAVRSLDVTLHVFLTRGDGLFPPRPDYSRTETLRTDRLTETGLDPMIYLDGDFNRDGRADLLILDEDDNLEIYLSTEMTGGLFGGRGDFTYQDRPAVKVKIKVPRTIRIVDLQGDGLSEVLLLYDRSVTVGGWGLGEDGGR